MASQLTAPGPVGCCSQLSRAQRVIVWGRAKLSNETSRTPFRPARQQVTVGAVSGKKGQSSDEEYEIVEEVVYVTDDESGGAGEGETETIVEVRRAYDWHSLVANYNGEWHG